MGEVPKEDHTIRKELCTARESGKGAVGFKEAFQALWKVGLINVDRLARNILEQWFEVNILDSEGIDELTEWFLIKCLWDPGPMKLKMKRMKVKRTRTGRKRDTSQPERGSGPALFLFTCG